MASFTAKYDLKKLKDIAEKAASLKTPIDKPTAKAVGEAVVSEIKSQISKGNSPIEGNGKFPAYKNPKRYPGDRKPKTPVNLELEGDFLDSLDYSIFPNSTGYGTEIGYSSSQEIKEEGHRKGARGQPKRPSLPSRRGEDFSAKIRKIFASFYRERIKAIFK